MMINKKESHAVISGKTSDGARYIQGGIRFKPNGHPVAGQEIPEPIVAAPENVLPRPDIDNLESSQLNVKSAREIQKMVERLGGEYTNKREGIEFIIQESLKANDIS